MAGWKCNVVNKVKAISCEAITHRILYVFSAELAKILSVYDDPLTGSGFHLFSMEPAAADPELDYLGSDMECLSQCVFCELSLPIFALAPRRYSICQMEPCDRRINFAASFIG